MAVERILEAGTRFIRRVIRSNNEPLPPLPDLNQERPKPSDDSSGGLGARLKPKKPEGSAGAAAPIPTERELVTTRVRDRRIV